MPAILGLHTGIPNQPIQSARPLTSDDPRPWIPTSPCTNSRPVSDSALEYPRQRCAEARGDGVASAVPPLFHQLHAGAPHAVDAAAAAREDQTIEQCVVAPFDESR